MSAEALWYWMEERERIRLARAQGLPKPWTADPVLQTYRFCNVNREDDTVTRWIDTHIRRAHAEHPNLWLMLCIARWINRTETLESLFNAELMPTRPTWTPKMQDGMAAHLDTLLAAKLPVYTGAYMIRAESNPSAEWYAWSKQRYIVGIVLGHVWAKRAEILPLLEKDFTPQQKGNPWRTPLRHVHAWFAAQYGWGGFMAYEVVTDLRHTRYLRGAPDIMLWANAGPGAIRGLNRLAGRPLAFPLKQAQANDEMQKLLSEAQARYPGGLNGHRLEMRDIEHSLCETDKHLRVTLGEGRPRARYAGR